MEALLGLGSLATAIVATIVSIYALRATSTQHRESALLNARSALDENLAEIFARFEDRLLSSDSGEELLFRAYRCHALVEEIGASRVSALDLAAISYAFSHRWETVLSRLYMNLALAALETRSQSAVEMSRVQEIHALQLMIGGDASAAREVIEASIGALGKEVRGDTSIQHEILVMAAWARAEANGGNLEQARAMLARAEAASRRLLSPLRRHRSEERIADAREYVSLAIDRWRSRDVLRPPDC